MKKLATLIFILAAMNLSAQEKMQPLVTVSGEGTVKVVPDEVNIQVSVESSGKKAIDVKKENDATMDAVLRFLKQAGIASKDMQTQHVRLNKNYDYQTKTYSYNAFNSLTIKLRDINQYETVITGLTESGVNRIDWIKFGSSKEDELKSQARAKAIHNAKAKAMEYAAALDQKIGKAVQISESGSVSPPTPMYRSAMMDMESSQSQETLAVGEMSIKAQINVSFELQ